MPAQRVPLSGAMKNIGLDGDITASWFLAEVKGRTPLERSEGAQINVPLKWWTKVREEAELAGKPALVIVHPKGSPNNFVIADFDQLMELLGKAARALGEDDGKTYRTSPIESRSARVRPSDAAAVGPKHA